MPIDLTDTRYAPKVGRCPGCAGWLYRNTECVTCALLAVSK